MKIIIFYKKTNKIENIIDAKDIQSTIEILKEKNILTKDKDYKTFENIKCYVGLDIRAVKANGDVMSTEEQIDVKLITLAEDEKYDKEKDSIEKLSEIELCQKFPDRIPKTEKIETSDDGAKYITEKTMLQKLDDKLISIEEYNAYIIEQRRHAYKSTTDDLVIERMIDFLKENNVDVADIEEAKENIKSDLAKA